MLLFLKIRHLLTFIESVQEVCAYLTLLCSVLILSDAMQSKIPQTTRDNTWQGCDRGQQMSGLQ